MPAGQPLAVKPLDPGPDPQRREPHMLSNGRGFLPLGTGPDDLGPLHQPMGRRARVGQAREFLRFFSGQCTYLDSHDTPSTSFLEEV